MPLGSKVSVGAKGVAKGDFRLLRKDEHTISDDLLNQKIYPFKQISRPLYDQKDDTDRACEV